MKKLLINLILSLNIILMFSSAMATTYYVSSSMGSNSNDGLSPEKEHQLLTQAMVKGHGLIFMRPQGPMPFMPLFG